jgi:SAM-dependent methyltransferase
MPLPTPEDTDQTYWDGFYSGLAMPSGWAPTPNPPLVQEIEADAPGCALDLGCGTGGDAIWLAGRGWRVTAVDVSGAVLRRAEELARRADVASRIDWQRHDLTETFPTGEFVLVSAQFLHSPLERAGERDSILRRAMSAVAPGGSLLVAGHLGMPTWMDRSPFDVHLPSAAELLTALAPDPHQWSVATDRTVTREVRSPEGVLGTRDDTVLRLLRMPRAGESRSS